MKLDLGCGGKPVEGHVGVDLPNVESSWQACESLGPYHAQIDSQGIVRFDLCSGIPWPFADESVDGLFSSHLIEHVPAQDIAVHAWGTGGLGQSVLRRTGTQDALFWLMDEAWRVTKPGGRFLLRWPALVDEQTGEIQFAAFQDPTHRRFIPAQQVHYWSRAGRETLGVGQYRARCDWRLVPDELRDGKSPHLRQRRLTAPGVRLVENEVLLERGPERDG